MLKGAGKILRDNAPDFLCFEVIRVVVAGRQSVGADQDTALDLLTESFGSGVLIKIQEFVRNLRAMSKPYAIKT